MSIFLVLGLLALDLFTKYLVSQSLVLYQSIPVIKGWLHITFVHNTGAAFSMLEGKLLLFQIFTILAILGLGIVAYSMRKDRITYYIILVTLAGALGNLYDRIRFGYVRDFIDVKFFAVFNVADIFIVLGMIALVARLLYLEKKKDEKVN
ncbi:signal peptidase II [Clostridia bacterium]|nr:signal peptidase II [Clostridia bacterium]